MSQSTAIGIDLGTSYSRVGVWKNGRVEIISNEQGNPSTPSYVAFTDSEVLVGDLAKSQITRNPENTLFDMKRLIGRKFNNREIQVDIRHHWPFRVINNDSKPMIQVQFKGENKVYSPEEISSMILSKLKQNAEHHLGHKVKDAVISVPSFFNQSMRRATKKAGEIAGLNVLRIISENSAAGIAYLLNTSLTLNGKRILVVDFGGGTFDVSLLEMDSLIQVQAIAGDTHLGGEDFNNRLLCHFVEEIKQRHKKDLSTDPRALRRLYTACELAKRTLSSSSQASIEIDSLFDNIDFRSTITRTFFEELNSDLFSLLINPLERVLTDSALTKSSVDEILLIGGSTRIPKFQEMLIKYFNGKKLNRMLNPEEAVVCGAAAQAAILTGVISEKLDRILCVEAIPRSLGIETAGGVVSPVCQRNSNIPRKQSQIFSIVNNRQSTILIQIYEGDFTHTTDCNLLAKFELTGIPPAYRGIPQFEITFDVDMDGILEGVSVSDKFSGRVFNIPITDNYTIESGYSLVNNCPIYVDQGAHNIRGEEILDEEDSWCCMQ